MKTLTVELTVEELRYIRAGLSAHSIAMDPYRKSDDFDTRKNAYDQIHACRALSTKLGDILIASSN